MGRRAPRSKPTGTEPKKLGDLILCQRYLKEADFSKETRKTIKSFSNNAAKSCNNFLSALRVGNV